jgi:hypothetical protein
LVLNNNYRARASTSVTSSGCSLSPIQSSTAMVTIWLIWGRGQMTVVADQVDQPLFAEFSEVVFRFGDAVAVGKKNFAGMHLTEPSAYVMLSNRPTTVPPASRRECCRLR